MHRWTRRALRVSGPALALWLGGCASIPLLGPTEPVAPLDTATAAFKPIAMSRKDTCPTQRAIAEHNSVLVTLRTGKVEAYCAPCDCPQTPMPTPQPMPVQTPKPVTS